MKKNQHFTRPSSSPRPAKHSEAGSNSGDLETGCPHGGGHDSISATRKRRAWTPERRAAQAKRCRAAKPSQYSTGPKTGAGKATSSANALKHGLRSETVKELKRLLRLQKSLLALHK